VIILKVIRVIAIVALLILVVVIQAKVVSEANAKKRNEVYDDIDDLEPPVKKQRLDKAYSDIKRMVTVDGVSIFP